MSARSHLVSALAGAAVALGGQRLARSSQGRLALMSGSSLARPSAAAWVTDFLNAAYYAKDRPARDLADLRLAFTVLTTWWWRTAADRPSGRPHRISAADVLRFHRAFGTARLRGTGGRTGTLDRDALLAGGAQLLGDWFPDATGDRARTGWGIAFPTPADRETFDPELRLAQARLGPLTPPRRPESAQVWHTYRPVEVPDPAATAAAVLDVARWPDYASELGRFTPLRRRGLDGQTFEIEVVGLPTPRTPVFLRAYVTVTRLVTADDPGARDTYVRQLREGFAARRPAEEDPVPDGAEVHAAFDLTSHEGHFMGDARNRLVLYSHQGRSYLRAAGTWDPMQWHLAELYDRAGRYAQHAFWGMGSPEESMLHQIAAHAASGMAHQ